MKNVNLGNLSVSTIGRFKFAVNRDAKKFTLTNINAFVPFGKGPESKMLFKTEAGDVDSLLISKVSVGLRPDESVLDHHNVQVFIQHPDVRIGGMSDADHKKLVDLRIKSPKSKFMITNMDKVQTDNYDVKIKLIEARAVLFSTEKSISKEKLIWLCSSFGIVYRNNILDEKRYKIILKESIDMFIQREVKNIKLFTDAINNINETEMKFYIRELINMERIVDIGGIYKIGDRPVGASIDHIINYYDENKELYLQHQKDVKDNFTKVMM
jgi:hypothetical protein